MKRIDFLSVVHKFDFLIDLFHYKQTNKTRQTRQDKQGWLMCAKESSFPWRKKEVCGDL
jgi:hypothetical protein